METLSLSRSAAPVRTPEAASHEMGRKFTHVFFTQCVNEMLSHTAHDDDEKQEGIWQRLQAEAFAQKLVDSQAGHAISRAVTQQLLQLQHIKGDNPC